MKSTYPALGGFIGLETLVPPGQSPENSVAGGDLYSADGYVWGLDVLNAPPNIGDLPDTGDGNNADRSTLPDPDATAPGDRLTNSDSVAQLSCPGSGDDPGAASQMLQSNVLHVATGLPVAPADAGQGPLGIASPEIPGMLPYPTPEQGSAVQPGAGQPPIVVAADISSAGDRAINGASRAVDPPPATAGSVDPSGLQLLYAGFNYVADVNNSYADADSLQTMVSETGANAVALTDDWVINASTNTIYSDIHSDVGDGTGQTESLDNMKATALDAESHGLSVMFRPLIDFSLDESTAMLTSSNGTIYADGDWRAYYQPADTTAFFNSYDSMIVQEAEAAQAVHAQIFDIGTELDQLTGPDYQSNWTQIISDIRNVAGYTGKLTYSAISDDDLSPWQYGPGPVNPPAGTGNIETQISFWSQLDYVGIDEYAAVDPTDPNFVDNPQTDAQKATDLTDLIAGWEQSPTDPSTFQMTQGQSLIQYYEGVSAAIGKPLLFTEIGYNSAPDAAVQPFFTSSNEYDPNLQTLLYQAFIDAWQNQGNTSLQGVYLWNWEPDPSTVGAGDQPSWTPQGNSGALQVLDAAFTNDIACYCRGTQILTEAGEVAVEDLAIGDRLVTLSGEARPIRWIGRRGYDGRFIAGNRGVLPICVRRDAIMKGVPARDLWVSPEHSLYIDDVLVQAKHLINGITVAQAESVEEVEYFHIELDRHNVIYADGMLAETFVDCDNRLMFANGTEYVGLYPNDQRPRWCFCAPRLEWGSPELVAIRVWMFDRANALDLVAESDSGMHLVIDGEIQPLLNINNGSYRCEIPAGCREVWLCSRSIVPAEREAASCDIRRLGLPLERMVLSDAAMSIEAWHSHPAFRDGFYADEASHRWTDGNARIPDTLLRPFPGPFVLDVYLSTVLSDRRAA